MKSNQIQSFVGGDLLDVQQHPSLVEVLSLAVEMRAVYLCYRHCSQEVLFL